MLVKGSYVAIGLCVVAAGAVLALALQRAWGATTCPDQICAEPGRCGGQPWGRLIKKPPGPMSWCSRDQEHNPCEWCDGTNSIRFCAPGNGYECIRVAPSQRTPCGQPKTGICTKGTFLGMTIYYCRDDGGQGTGDCKSSQECSSDKPC